MKLEEIIAEVARRETGSAENFQSFVARVILPNDVGLAAWVWSENKNKIQTEHHLAICGIQCQYFIQVNLLKGPAHNIVEILTTGQPLYKPFWWRKKEELLVDFKILQKTPPNFRSIHFSFLGFVIEPFGMEIAPY